MSDKSHLLIIGLNDLFLNHKIEAILERMLLMNIDNLKLSIETNQVLYNLGVKSVILDIIKEYRHTYFHYTLDCDTRVLDYDVIKQGAIDGAIVGSGLIKSTCIMKVNIVERYGSEKFDIDVINCFVSSFIDLQVGLSSLDFKPYKELTIKLYDTLVRYFVLDKKNILYSFRNLADDIFKDKTIDFWMNVRVSDKEDRAETIKTISYILEFVHKKGVISNLYLKFNAGLDKLKRQQEYDTFLRCLRNIQLKAECLTLVLDIQYKGLYTRNTDFLRYVFGDVKFRNDLDKSDVV